MKDFISFSLRGAWGGAIGAVIAWFLFYVLSFGPFWGLLFVLHPIVLVYLAVPGALVGLILWILTGRTAESLNAISRGAIGTGVILGLIALLSIYQLAWQVNQLGLIELNLLRIFQVTIIEAVFLGGAITSLPVFLTLIRPGTHLHATRSLCARCSCRAC